MEAPMESPTKVLDDFGFRASKRRKVSSRVRADSNQEDEDTNQIDQQMEQAGQEAPSTTIVEESDQEELGLNYVIRARKQQQRRQRGGIEFTATRPTMLSGGAGGEEAANSEKERRDAERAAAGAGTGDMDVRFARQTGYKAQVDQHMTAYIDAELAKRNLSMSNANSSTTSPLLADGSMRENRTSTVPCPTGESNAHQPPSATTGALQEVDLQSRMAPGESPATKPNPKPPRSRLGPDGKPWRSRRPQRTSDDLKRDALVESLLQEHGLNTFEAQAVSTRDLVGSNAGAAMGTDEDADERAAAEFRRQFLEAAEERRESVGTSGGQGKQQKAASGSEIAGGPKLGGSRSQRAKMHALELEREKEKKVGRR